MLYFREFAIQVSSEYKNSLKRCAKMEKYRTLLNQAYFWGALQKKNLIILTSVDKKISVIFCLT